jgi:hypothetical protein
VDDAVEPSAHVADVGLAGEREPRPQERLLQDVLGARVVEPDPPAVAQQRTPVAVHERLEGAFVPGSSQRRQALVGLGAEKANGDLRAHGGRRDFVRATRRRFAPTRGRQRPSQP